jgi:hypothetical protein
LARRASIQRRTISSEEHGWDDRIAKLVEEQFGLKPKEQTYAYQQPYHEWFDRIPLLHRYKIPDFSKFLGQDDMATIEHIS